jgi:hypothetical protein
LHLLLIKALNRTEFFGIFLKKIKFDDIFFWKMDLPLSTLKLTSSEVFPLEENENSSVIFSPKQDLVTPDVEVRYTSPRNIIARDAQPVAHHSNFLKNEPCMADQSQKIPVEELSPNPEKSKATTDQSGPCMWCCLICPFLCVCLCCGFCLCLEDAFCPNHKKHAFGCSCNNCRKSLKLTEEEC